MGKGSAGKKKSAKLRKSDSNNTLVKSLDSEIDLYLSMEELNKDFSPLQWWKKNIAIFPLLSDLAAKFLSSPPSSIESERLFSIEGNVYSPHRNWLTANTGEILMFLNYNLRIFDFKY